MEVKQEKIEAQVSRLVRKKAKDIAKHERHAGGRHAMATMSRA